MHSVIFIVGLILDIRCSASRVGQCICVCLYVCPYLYLSLYVSLLVCFCLSVYVSVCVPLRLWCLWLSMAMVSVSVYRSVSSVNISVCVCLCLSLFLCLFVSACLCVCICRCLYSCLCLPVCLCFTVSVCAWLSVCVPIFSRRSKALGPKDPIVKGAGRVNTMRVLGVIINSELSMSDHGPGPGPSAGLKCLVHPCLENAKGPRLERTADARGCNHDNAGLSYVRFPLMVGI